MMHFRKYWLLLGACSLAAVFLSTWYIASHSGESGNTTPVSLRSHEFVADSGTEAMFLVERSLHETRPSGSTAREVLTRQADEDEDVWRVYLFFQEGKYHKSAYQVVRKSWVPSSEPRQLDLMGPAIVWSR
jgi:hypothetical protein